MRHLFSVAALHWRPSTVAVPACEARSTLEDAMRCVTGLRVALCSRIPLVTAATAVLAVLLLQSSALCEESLDRVDRGKVAVVCPFIANTGNGSAEQIAADVTGQMCENLSLAGFRATMVHASPEYTALATAIAGGKTPENVLEVVHRTMQQVGASATADMALGGAVSRSDEQWVVWAFFYHRMGSYGLPSSWVGMPVPDSTKLAQAGIAVDVHSLGIVAGVGVSPTAAADYCWGRLRDLAHESVEARVDGVTQGPDGISWGRREAALWVSFTGSYTGSPSNVDRIVGLLRDKDKRVRTAAAQALSSLSGLPAARGALIAALRDEEDWVRTAATTSLAAHSSLDSLDALLGIALKDRSAQVRLAAISALSLIGEADSGRVGAALASLATGDGDYQVRTAAVEAGFGLARRQIECQIAQQADAIEREPGNADHYYRRGGLYNVLTDYDQAVADLSKAIELRPDYAEAYALRGNARFRSGDAAAGLADCDRAIELRPSLPDGYVQRGFCLADKGDLERALADFGRAIELDGKCAAAYLGRGMIWEQKRDPRKARREYQRAVELDPSGFVGGAARTAMTSVR